MYNPEKKGQSAPVKHHEKDVFGVFNVILRDFSDDAHALRKLRLQFISEFSFI